MRAWTIGITAALAAAPCFNTVAADEALPNYDPVAYCKRVSDMIGKSAWMTKACLDQEQSAYDELKPVWAGLPDPMKQTCQRQASMIGRSYWYLKACVDQESTATKQLEGYKFRR